MIILFYGKNIYTRDSNCFRLSYICKLLYIVKCGWQCNISAIQKYVHMQQSNNYAQFVYLPLQKQFRYDNVHIFVSVVLNISLYHKYVLDIKKELNYHFAWVLQFSGSCIVKHVVYMYVSVTFKNQMCSPQQQANI